MHLLGFTYYLLAATETSPEFSKDLLVREEVGLIEQRP
jgi:hypothetical protein